MNKQSLQFLPKDTNINKSSIILKSWTGNRISHVRSTRLVIENPMNGRKNKLTFHVVTEDFTRILGSRAIATMIVIFLSQ